MATRTTADVARSTGASRNRSGGRTLASLGGLAASATVFALLLVLVRLNWPPLESVDHGLARDFNDAVNDSSAFLAVVRAITNLGGPTFVTAVFVLAIAYTLLRRQPRLAAYLAVTGTGALILDPTLKVLVGRLRPVVAHPVAHGTGNSFPSGHALGSVVCYGALLLAFLPAFHGVARRVFASLMVALIVIIGFSRIALGVHYLSDVVGAWALGIAWLGLTAYAFQLWRRETGRRVTRPLQEGLEPEAASDVQAAPDHAPTRAATVGRIIGVIAVGWVLTFGLVVGWGKLVMTYGGGNLLGDRSIPKWFEAHRTPGGNSFSQLWSDLGNTHWIMYVAIAAGVVLLATTRHWRTVVFLVLALVGELSLFLASAAVIGRPRPEVSHLEAHLPTSSYPSGHFAATICLYVTIALFAITRIRGWWRYLFLIPAIAMPVLVAGSRMYRGMHHPTDLLGSVLLATGWLLTLWYAIQPNNRLPGRDTDAHTSGTAPDRGLPSTTGGGERVPVESGAPATHGDSVAVGNIPAARSPESATG